MGPKEISVKARYCRDCVIQAARRQERLLNNGLTPDQHERLSKVLIDTKAADEFARLAAIDSPLHGSDIVAVEIEGDTPQAIAALLSEAAKVLPLITSQPESTLDGSLRIAARTTEMGVSSARQAIKVYLAETA